MSQGRKERNRGKGLLATIPNDKLDFRPDTQGRSMGELGQHIAEIEAIFSTIARERTTFGDGPDSALYLAPVPEEPFIRLTKRIMARWPEAPPYGGIYERVIPHLTVAMLGGPVPVADIQKELQPHLPISARAERVELMAQGADGRWGPLDRVELRRG